MTDFIQKLHENITTTSGKTGLAASDITRLSLSFINEELGSQKAQFQKSLSKLGEKTREKMGVFGDQLKASHERIMDALEVVQEMMFLWEQAGNDKDWIAKTLEMRIDYNKQKAQVLQRQSQMVQSEQEHGFDEPITSTYVIKCHTHHALQPCTPENDQIIDEQLTNSIKDLYSSLEQTLSSFQNNYGHELNEETIHLVSILRQEYELALSEIDSSPSWQQIKNIKELQMMIRGTVQHKIYEIRQRQREVEHGITLH